MIDFGLPLPIYTIIPIILFARKAFLRFFSSYKDETATQQLAAKLEKEAELGKEGIVGRYKEHRQKPLAEHVEDFGQSLPAKGDTTKQIKQVTSRVNRPQSQRAKKSKCQFT